MTTNLDRRTFLKQTGVASLALPMMSFTRNTEKKPNILIILADDMGFSDIGCYGGEINTPHINKLAEDGLRFTRFYNAARCSPTRASLLTGLYPHQAGMGKLASTTPQEEGPYQGWLNDQCVTIAEMLQPAGYRTLMSGKWHVGEERPNWPVDRGFDRFWGLVGGTATYWDLTNGMKMALDDQIWEPDPADVDAGNFFMTDAITDYAIDFLNEHDNEYGDQSFFMYLTYTAPHWPLHAHQEDIAKYQDRYKEGWDVLREERYERMKSMGLITDSWQLSNRDQSDWNKSALPAWDSLDDDEKQYQSEIMAVYAAMIDRMDQNIGRILEYLKASESLDNTLILFLSDNGACAEIPNWATNNDLVVDPNAPLGSRYSFVSTGPAWANASNTPLRYFKQYNHEGGVSTPLIAHWPAGIPEKNKWVDHRGHVMDIMPTCLDLAGVKYPREFEGREITSSDGISLLPLLQGQENLQHETIYFEHVGNCGMIQGDWKLSMHKKIKSWELYNLTEDRCEMNDLAVVHPQILSQMGNQWLIWAEDVGVNIKHYMRRLPDLSKVKAIDTAAPTFELSNNYPNPFNVSTWISYEFWDASHHVTIDIIDSEGRHVKNLARGNRSVGKYHILWNGKDDNGHTVPSGNYLCKVSVDNHRLSSTTKLTLIK